MTELQLGKHEFISYEFDDEYEKLLRELELLSLNDQEREKRRKEIRRKLAKIRRNQNALSIDYQIF